LASFEVFATRYLKIVFLDITLRPWVFRSRRFDVT